MLLPLIRYNQVFPFTSVYYLYSQRIERFRQGEIILKEGRDYLFSS